MTRRNHPSPPSPHRPFLPALPFWPAATAAALLASALAVYPQDPGLPAEIDSVAGLKFQAVSTNVLLGWPSDPRETFAVLWRSNSTLEAPWITLSAQLHAAPGTDKTTFSHFGAASSQGPAANRDLKKLYRVLVIPDFWFDMEGAVLAGGPSNPGEDFLPFYYGTTATRLLKPRVELLVDGQPAGVGGSLDEDVQRVNFGTLENPRWACTAGLWFDHGNLPDGTHTLQIQTLLQLNSPAGPWSWSVILTNRPVRVYLARRPAKEEVKGSQQLLGIRRAKSQPGWWEWRLGRNFARTPPSAQDAARHFIYSEADDLPSKTEPRPWKSSLPAGSNNSTPP